MNEKSFVPTESPSTQYSRNTQGKSKEVIAIEIMLASLEAEWTWSRFSSRSNWSCLHIYDIVQSDRFFWRANGAYF